jgi:hypothetical protein
MDDNRTLLAGIVGSFIADAIHAKATASPSGNIAPQWHIVSLDTCVCR